MSDMLVKLYTIPELLPYLAAQQAAGVTIRRPLAPEKHLVVDWVRKQFGAAWASECEVAFSSHPVSAFMAIAQESIIGFACYDVTCKNFFGPTGVAPQARHRGTGTALLIACLHAMREGGYAYAIIGGAGPTEFYARTVGAVAIEGSEPGIYRGMLKTPN